MTFPPAEDVPCPQGTKDNSISRIALERLYILLDKEENHPSTPKLRGAERNHPTGQELVLGNL